MPFCEKQMPMGETEAPSDAGDTIRHITKMVSEKLNLDQITPSLLKLPCADFVGYLAVYRICFVVTVFFFFNAILFVGVQVTIQNYCAGNP